MNKQDWEYLKKYDPIHYAEMMGDPVTGIKSNNDTGIGIFLVVILLLVIGFVIGISIK